MTDGSKRSPPRSTHRDGRVVLAVASAALAMSACGDHPLLESISSESAAATSHCARTFYASSDTTISEFQPDSNLGNLPNCSAFGGLFEYACLVKWNLFHFHPDPTITAAR